VITETWRLDCWWHWCGDVVSTWHNVVSGWQQTSNRSE